MRLRAQLRLGRVAGIEIGLHFSWFIIAVLITFSLVAHFHEVTPQWTNVVIWSAALVTAVLFFAALLLHELAHSVVAKAKGLRVRAITLFALGGVSQIESEASDAKSEFLIAIAGPLTSIAIGGAFLAMARLTGWPAGSEPTAPLPAILLWLGYINVALAGFNMIPGYPLDGGRVLRAAVWGITGNQARATRAAARVGEAIAVLFILLGLYRFFLGANFGGLWFAFIGWFLLDAARSSEFQLELMAELRSRRVSDIMDRDCATVDGQMSVQEFVEEHLLRTGNRCFIVMQNTRIAGMVTPSEVKRIPREDWPNTSLQGVMRPLNEVRTVTPDTPAIEAMEMMSRDDLNQLPVISDGHVAGVFSRAHVLRFLQLHAELGGR
jgi:Zn-dependent protease/predicted transcriptional regulator